MSTDAKPLIVGAPTESFPGEQRVALVPAGVAALKKAGLDVIVEAGAGTSASFTDGQFSEQGAEVVTDRADLFNRSNIIVQVRAGGANVEAGKADVERLREGQVLIASCDPLSEPAAMNDITDRRATCFALELVPRITRAQSMDVLSSMATIAGYKAVLLAADHLPRMFPMMMTAAGTLKPAKVLIVGVGVAGLQAIATAKRLGAVVRAYDIRPAVKEQVESLGAKFVELKLETAESEQKGGYAKAMDEDFYRRQQELMAKVVAESDVVITTAAIPGKKAPILVTTEMVTGMAASSVIIDLAAERGGNCELTKAGEVIVEHGVTIVGPLNLPSAIPGHASEMYSKNVTTFLLQLIQDGAIEVDLNDEVIHDTLICRGGILMNARVRELLNLDPLEAAIDREDMKSTVEFNVADIPAE